VEGEGAAAGSVATAARAEGRIGSAGSSVYTSTRPAEEVFPELAGVNPHYVEGAPVGTNINCVSCAIAAQDRLTGKNPVAVATPSERYGNRDNLLSAAPFGLQPITTVAGVQQEMLAAGNGAVGVVVIPLGGTMEHVINVVNRNGVIYFVDNQLGKIVTLPPGAEVYLGRP
jgi:Papain fold toxin 1, glutamine deamidase